MAATHLSDEYVFCFPQTFLTLSLQDMASRVQLSGPQEAEKYVLHMVSPFRHFSFFKHEDDYTRDLSTAKHIFY